MTEAEWLAATEPRLMLDFLRWKVSDRKLRLFAAECCRQMPSHLLDGKCSRSVDVAELYADKKTSKAALNRARGPLVSAGRTAAELAAGWAACSVACTAAVNASAFAIEAIARPDVVSRQVAAIRDIFGNPFRLVAVDPRWLTSTVVALAAGIYAERAFDRLPILADALQDAGCEHPDILAHCRGDGPHARGCWVVDLVLGKS